MVTDNGDFMDNLGWWLTHTPEKYEFVNWDDYSKYMGKSKLFHGLSYPLVIIYDNLCLFMVNNG